MACCDPEPELSFLFPIVREWRLTSHFGQTDGASLPGGAPVHRLTRMRAMTVAMILAIGCGASSLSGASSSDAGADTDVGPTFAGPAQDAGPAATIQSIPCPLNPTVLWSRTFADEVDFRGIAGEDGSLYWIEYDPPPTSYRDLAASAWIGSADANGRDRFRVRTGLTYPVDAHLIAGDLLVVAKGAIVAAFDAANGSSAWSLDLRHTYTSDHARSQGIADLGNGKLALAMHDDKIASGLYIVEEATGVIVWSAVGGAEIGYRVQGSDGAGVVIASGNYENRYSPEVFAVDSSGRELWRHRIGEGELLAWPSGAPWIKAPGTSFAHDYVPVPNSWVTAIGGSDLVFAVKVGSASTSPNVIDVVRGAAIVASGALQGTNSYDDFTVFPFLAGGGDHAVVVTQMWPSYPGLCHPSRAAEAAIERFDSTSSWQCALSFDGESGIEGAALLPGRLVIGRRTYLTDACTDKVQPVTIEAYSLPGESLAASGWVQKGGGPGMGLRQKR